MLLRENGIRISRKKTLNKRFKKKGDKMKMKCSLCKKEFDKDRYNVKLELERQDIPKETKWQSSTENPVTDCCSECYETIVWHYKETIRQLKRK